MKNVFIISFIICCISTHNATSQTLELEKQYQAKVVKDNYNSKYNSEKKIATVRELLNYPDYPKVPYDTVAQNFDFRFTIPVSDSLQKVVYDKLLEWSVASFIQPDFGIKLQDDKNLKIVVYGYSGILSEIKTFYNKNIELKRDCRYSIILKISDGKLEGRFYDVEYVFYNVNSNENYYHTSRDMQKISSLFPLTKPGAYDMEFRVALIIATALEFKRIEQEITNYIKNP